jgi:hypothetical protein
MESWFEKSKNVSPEISPSRGIKKRCVFRYDVAMLKPLDKLNPEDRAKCEQNGWIAYDPIYKSTLRKDSELVKPGRLAKYYFYIPGLMMRVIWARTDEEAISNANLGAT